MAAYAMQMESAGVPSVMVLTEAFKSVANNAIQARKVPDFPMVVLPHPFNTKPADEVSQIAEERLPEIIEKLRANPRPAASS